MDRLGLNSALPNNWRNTAAIEHFTALMSERFCCTPTNWTPCICMANALWAWHAVEETEHKGRVSTSSGRPATGIRIATLTGSVLFTLFSTRDFLTLLYASGHFWDARMWIRAYGIIWGEKDLPPHDSVLPAIYRRIFTLPARQWQQLQSQSPLSESDSLINHTLVLVSTSTAIRGKDLPSGPLKHPRRVFDQTDVGLTFSVYTEMRQGQRHVQAYQRIAICDAR